MPAVHADARLDDHPEPQACALGGATLDLLGFCYVSECLPNGVAFAVRSCDGRPALTCGVRRRPPAYLQIDAHLDFVDVRHGVRYGHGNCMRRAAELPSVSGLLQRRMTVTLCSDTHS